MTGGTGFILSYVAERYAEIGDTVVLFDNNEQHQMPRYTVDLLEKRKNVSFIQGDIRDKVAVEDVIKGADIVYHYAALMGTSSRFKQEVRTIEVNVIGTLHVCQAALDANVKYYVYPPRPMQTGWRTPYIISKTASTDMTQMDDVVDACMMAPNDAAIGRIIEVGTGINTSVKRVAELIIKITGSKSKIEFKPLRTGEVKIHTKSNLSDAKQFLGWEWKTKLEDGLRKTVPWYAQQLGLELPREFAA